MMYKSAPSKLFYVFWSHYIVKGLTTSQIMKIFCVKIYAAK